MLIQRQRKKRQDKVEQGSKAISAKIRTEKNAEKERGRKFLLEKAEVNHLSQRMAKEIPRRQRKREKKRKGVRQRRVKESQKNIF